jgi:hypothetical protein
VIVIKKFGHVILYSLLSVLFYYIIYDLCESSYISVSSVLAVLLIFLTSFIVSVILNENISVNELPIIVLFYTIFTIIKIIVTNGLFAVFYFQHLLYSLLMYTAFFALSNVGIMFIQKSKNNKDRIQLLIIFALILVLILVISSNRCR